METALPLPASSDQTFSKRKIALWASAGFFLLLMMSVSRLSSAPRIKNYLFGRLNGVITPLGYQVTAEETSISFFLGISLEMKNVRIASSQIDQPILLDTLTLSPSLFSALVGKLGGSISVQQQKGKMKAHFGIKDQNFSISMSASSFPLAQTQLLAFLSGIKVNSGTLDGDLDLAGKFSVPSSMEGDFKLDIKEMKMDPQTMGGMMPLSLPALHFSQVHLEGTAGQGKAQIKSLKVGDPKKESDDIRGQLSGDLTLGRNWDEVDLNLKTQFTVSESIRKILFLLDSLMNNTKQPDGSYLAKLTGRLSNIQVGNVKE